MDRDGQAELAQGEGGWLNTKSGFHQHRSNRRFTELQLFLTAS